MSTQVCENLAMINGDDEVKEMELFGINGDLLLSLMEESQDDESDDDDRLDSLIRSLEAEISGTAMEDELASNGSQPQDGQSSWIIGAIEDGQDYWAESSCDLDMECVDMDVMPSSPWDARSWCIDSYGGEMDGISDILYVNNLKMENGFAMGEQAYNSFWKESYIVHE
ncbi:hypothetical protein L6164_022749 [Bauhinia variegata]|uniref:Uncharacterized protein n=1 Tax=Bauhinia variegata TaxID=167791 RepID=A0ACB9MHH2_BAUVA|nr:hypothetical protein L6164_022749 [Bauhinia variegata]